MAVIRLVLGDGAEIFAKGLARLLDRQQGIKVECICSTGLEVIESAYKYQPDAILMDIKLSECSGVEVMKHIHEGLPKTRIIVLTHSEADDDIISAIRAGAKAYLSKDISIRNLIKTITLVANGEVVISSPMAVKILGGFSFLEESKDAAKLIAFLSKREQTVLSLVAQGCTNREIANTLVISENTVKVHLRNIMEKLHAHTREKAVSLVGGKSMLPRVYAQTDTK